MVVAAWSSMPVAVLGATTGMIGLASASAQSTINALYSSDSETRHRILTELNAAFNAQPTQKFDTQTADWILPALNQCKTDEDSNVVALANEIIEYIGNNMISAPQ
mgnify:CR=1 FL=1